MKKTDFPDHTLKKDPVIHPLAFVAPGAVVVGDVTIGESSSVWYNAVLRGDINFIRIGDRSNIQDGCILHLENDRPCIVGNDVTVGHGAILHGCVIEDNCLIGMGAIVLNGAVVKSGSIVAAGAVIRENEVIENALYAGVPAKKVRDIDPSETIPQHQAWAAKYCRLSTVHAAKKCAGK